MKISIVSIEKQDKTTKTGNTYQSLTIIYKNLDFNKVESKTLNPFGDTKNAFEALQNVKGGFFDVQVTKNARGYNDWTDAKSISESEASVKSYSGSSGAKHQGSATPARSNFETPEERAKRQVLIVKQSCLSTAATVLTAGVKSPPNPDDVMTLAQQFVNFVFATGDDKSNANKEPTIENMEDDIPY